MAFTLSGEELIGQKATARLLATIDSADYGFRVRGSLRNYSCRLWRFSTLRYSLYRVADWSIRHWRRLQVWTTNRRYSNHRIRGSNCQSIEFTVIRWYLPDKRPIACPFVAFCLVGRPPVDFPTTKYFRFMLAFREFLSFRVFDIKRSLNQWTVSIYLPTGSGIQRSEFTLFKTWYDCVCVDVKQKGRGPRKRETRGGRNWEILWATAARR